MGIFQVMENVYYDAKNAGSYGGIDNLADATKENKYKSRSF